MRKRSGLKYWLRCEACGRTVNGPGVWLRPETVADRPVEGGGETIMGLKRATRTLEAVNQELLRCMERLSKAANDPGLSETNKSLLREMKVNVENTLFHAPMLEED